MLNIICSVVLCWHMLLQTQYSNNNAHCRYDPFDVSDILGDDDADDDDDSSYKTHTNNQPQSTRRPSEATSSATTTLLSASTNVSTGAKKYHYHC